MLDLNLEPCQLEEHGGHSGQRVGILGAICRLSVLWHSEWYLSSGNVLCTLKIFEEVDATESL